MSLGEKEPSSAATVETQNAVSARSLHTPGPWDFDGGEVIGGRNVLPRWSLFHEEFSDTTGRFVCYSIKTFSYLNAREADVRLIAAAPELLEACKIALEQYKQDIAEIGPCDHAVNVCICGLVSDAHAIKAAIEKAEGAASVPSGSKSDHASYSK